MRAHVLMSAVDVRANLDLDTKGEPQMFHSPPFLYAVVTIKKMQKLKLMLVCTWFGAGL